MTTHTVNKSVHATLSTTDPDIIDLGDEYTQAEVINRSNETDSVPLYIDTRTDDDGVLVDAVAEANDTDIAMPGEAVIVKLQGAGMSIIGDANDYSVIGVG